MKYSIDKFADMISKNDPLGARINSYVEAQKNNAKLTYNAKMMEAQEQAEEKQKERINVITKPEYIAAEHEDFVETTKTEGGEVRIRKDNKGEPILNKYGMQYQSALRMGVDPAEALKVVRANQKTDYENSDAYAIDTLGKFIGKSSLDISEEFDVPVEKVKETMNNIYSSIDDTGKTKVQKRDYIYDELKSIGFSSGEAEKLSQRIIPLSKEDAMDMLMKSETQTNNQRRNYGIFDAVNQGYAGYKSFIKKKYKNK